jgi:hypothetical protein
VPGFLPSFFPKLFIVSLSLPYFKPASLYITTSNLGVFTSFSLRAVFVQVIH